jgi:hypothetical protein
LIEYGSIRQCSGALGCGALGVLSLGCRLYVARLPRNAYGEGLLLEGKIGMFSRVYRCEDGHLFTADRGKLVVASFHFGRAKYLQCPVDHRPVMAMPIKGSRLTEEQISQASQYKF